MAKSIPLKHPRELYGKTISEVLVSEPSAAAYLLRGVPEEDVATVGGMVTIEHRERLTDYVRELTEPPEIVGLLHVEDVMAVEAAIKDFFHQCRRNSAARSAA